MENCFLQAFVIPIEKDSNVFDQGILASPMLNDHYQISAIPTLTFIKAIIFFHKGIMDGK